MTNIEKKQIDLIKESICVYTKYMECRTLFKEGRLCFSNIVELVDDKGKSCLFRLKEMCHALFRNSDEATYKEKLYDITVGYIFHESMKLRENLYQLEFYGPNYDKVSEQLTDQEKKIFHEIDVLTKKARNKLKEEIKELKMLITELMEQLKDLIRLYGDNYLLPRFIVKNEKSLISIYGKNGFERLLNGLYSDGRAILIFRAAMSYLESEYYELARSMFRKISKAGKENRTALFFYMYSSAFHYYFKNRFSRSLIFAEQANAMDVNLESETYVSQRDANPNENNPPSPPFTKGGMGGFSGENIYRESLQKLISDLLKEVRKTKRL